ncbi:MAG: hypothetical protein F7B60_06135 [Desulfurococcales archaeon]|nr:hypothetical protein [Desulfurococcales archaeon]
MAKKTIIYNVSGYSPDILKVKGIKLGVLKRVKEDWKEKKLRSRQGPLDALLSYATRVSKDKELRDLGYVEVAVEAPGLVVTHGDRPNYDWDEVLFPSPSKLIRIGVVRKKETDSGKFQVEDKDIKWIDVASKEVYVFEGFCEAPEDALLVILDTEKGRRTLTQCKPVS